MRPRTYYVMALRDVADFLGQQDVGRGDILMFLSREAAQEAVASGGFRRVSRFSFITSYRPWWERLAYALRNPGDLFA